MVTHLRYKFCFVLFLIAAIALACEDQPMEVTIPAFDRPEDVALICYDTNEKVTLPISCCKQDGVPSNEECGMGIPYAELYAFVTQTTIGEVAVVNVKDFEIIDQEVGIPYSSFIPVGGQPTDIAALGDGSMVLTANYETGDLSLIQIIQGDVSLIDNPSLIPAVSVDLGGPASQIAIPKQPSNYAGKFAFVTQPSLGRLAVVAFDTDVCGGSLGCMVGYLMLRAEGEYDDMDAGVDEEDAGPGGSPVARPWAIEISHASPSMFVGILGAEPGEELVEIDGEVLISEALSLVDQPVTEPVELSPSAIVQYLDCSGKEVAALSIEPTVEKWLYGIDNISGDVFVVNLRDNQVETLKDGTTTLKIPGRAIAIELFRENESVFMDPLDPFTFNGTFGLVSSTLASLYVVDVDNENQDPAYPHPHSLRSFVNFNETPPGLFEPPEWVVDGDLVAFEETENYAWFEYAYLETLEEGDTAEEPDFPECDDDEGIIFEPEVDWGFRFRCDHRESSTEFWTMEWQGTVGISGAAVIVDENSDGTMLLRDEAADFCDEGMKVDVRFEDAEAGEPGSGSGDYQDYLGDVLVITSEPSPADENTDCSFFEDYSIVPAMYKIVRLPAENEVIISNTLPVYGEGTEGYPLPTEACFGQAFSYEIRAYRHYVLVGSESGRMRDDGVWDAETELCVAPDGFDELRTQRIYPGVLFANDFFTFTLFQGDYYQSVDGGFLVGGVDIEDTDAETTYSLPTGIHIVFQTTGFFAMQMQLGSNITDIEVTPDQTFAVVEQSALGFALVGIVGAFNLLGPPVN